jgi:hypothetical protein
MEDTKKVEMQSQRMSMGKGKPKELKTFELGGKTYFVLPEQPTQVWQLDRWILNESGIEVPDAASGESLVATFDEEKKTLVVKKVTMEYNVEVKGL